MKTPELLVGYLWLIISLVACTEQGAEEISANQNAQKVHSLAMRMAEDPNVIAFMENNEAYLELHRKWLASMPKEKREAYQEAIRKGERRGMQPFNNYEFIEPQDLTAFREKQLTLTTEIRNRFPELYDLPEKEQTRIKSHVIRLISQKKIKE